MKKFKDFLYDTNDIIIAVIILALAAMLILWRINVIMEYPKTLIASDEATESSVLITPEEITGTSTDGDDATSDDSTDQTSTDDSASIWNNDVLSKDIQVTVSGDSASAAIQCLIDAGLFSDYSDYQTTCANAGLDDEKVSAGTFTFVKGSSKSDVAATVNWG